MRAWVLYLDVCHLSAMAKDSLGLARAEDSANLRDRLLALADADEVVCPISLWHVAELAKYGNGEVLDEICRVLGRLSRSWAFRYPWDIFGDEVLRALSPAHCSTVRVIGPPPVLVPAATTSLEVVLSPGLRTTSSEELVRTLVHGMRDRPFLASVRSFSETVHQADLELAEERRLDVQRLVEVLRRELHSFMASSVTQEQIRIAASGSGKDPRPVLELSTTDALMDAGLRGYASAIEILARRSVDPMRRPKPSDPMDIGHLTLLPYCDAFLTERGAAAVAGPVAAKLGTSIFRKSTELLAWLASPCTTAGRASALDGVG